MNLEKIKNISPQTLAIVWIVTVFISLLLYIIFSAMSYFKIDALSIWVFSCIIIFYQSRKLIKKLSPEWGRNVIILGLLICAFSLLNIPLGFGNPPYSIGDFSIFLSGAGLVLFGLYRIKSYLFAVAIPFIAVIGFQLYELFLVHEQTLSAPLLPFTIFLTSIILSILGIPAVITGDIVYFVSKTGDPVYLQITPECTGIWSLGTFTIMVILVLATFPEGFTKRGLLLIGIGYLGTYIGNALRIGAISLSGYLYGPTGAIENTHLHFGWIFFLCWMIIFWYIFFTRILGISFNKRDKKIPKDV